MDKALEHISEQPRLQGFKEYIKLTKHDVSTISCTISHAFSAAQGTVGLMPMLQGHNQLPELLFPLARMTFCGFAWMLPWTGGGHVIAHEVFFCLGWQLTNNLLLPFFGCNKTKAARNHIHFTHSFHQKLLRAPAAKLQPVSPEFTATRGNISCRARKSLGGSRPSNIRRYASSSHDTHLRSYAMEKSSNKLGQKTPLFQHYGKSPWALIMMSS